MRVGIKPEGRAPAREGTEITRPTGERSARSRPAASGRRQRAVAMGYVETGFGRARHRLDAHRARQGAAAKVAPLPFVPHRYVRGSDRPSVKFVNRSAHGRDALHQGPRMDPRSTATSPPSASPTTRRAQLGDIVYVELPRDRPKAVQGRRGGRGRERQGRERRLRAGLAARWSRSTPSLDGTPATSTRTPRARAGSSS